MNSDLMKKRSRAMDKCMAQTLMAQKRQTHKKKRLDKFIDRERRDDASFTGATPRNLARPLEDVSCSGGGEGGGRPSSSELICSLLTLQQRGDHVPSETKGRQC